jgi:hypothetical protein
MRASETGATKDCHQRESDGCEAFHDLSAGLFTHIIRILAPALQVSIGMRR